MPQDNSVIMEGVRIVFRNFAGKESMYNQEGSRNFAVLLDDDIAERMAKDGWTIKRLKAREEGDDEQAYLPVEVKYKNRQGQTVNPPRIVMITSRGRTNIGEEECEVLDWADIANVDMIVRPYEWGVNGKSGIKAYLKSLYVTINEDLLELKYNALDQLPSRGGKTYSDEPPF